MNFYKSKIVVSIILIILTFTSSFSAFASGTEGLSYADGESTAYEEYLNFDVNAKAALLINETNGKILYEKNADKLIYPASTTKILTALIIIEAIENGEINLDDTFAADNSIYFDISYDGSTANIQPGEVLSVKDHLYCTLLASANESCNALAIYYMGSTETFVEKMNEYAADLGCDNSHFCNTHGMPNRDHYTTAKDLYLIFSEAVKHSLFVEVCSAVTYTVPATNLSNERLLTTSNRLLIKDSGYFYEFAVMGKTGTTTDAGNCLISIAEQDGEKLISVVMGANAYKVGNELYIESFSETKNLFQWGYENFSYHKVISSGEIVEEIPVKYGANADTVNIIAEDDVTVYMSNYDAEKNLFYRITPNNEESSLTAPVSINTEFGKIEAILNGEVIASSRLITASDVSLSYIAYAKAYVSENIEAVICASITVLIAVFLIAYIIKKKRSAKLKEIAQKEEQTNLENYENLKTEIKK